MTNEDIINFKNKTSLPEVMVDFINREYTKCDEDKPFPGAHWELACMKDNDWKYGRFYIDTKNKLWRGLTFSEFYGGGIVD